MAAGAPTREDLLGIWSLVSLETPTPTGGTKRPFGDSPTGTLVYLEGGTMFVRLAGSGEAEGLVWIYAGSWEIRGERVIHRVECSNKSKLVGQRLERRAVLEGDRLVLTTAETHGEGSPVLVWERPAARRK